MTEVEKLQNIKDTIEKMNKLQQIEVLKLLLEADIETSENGNGTFINLSELGEDITKLLDYIHFINKQNQLIDLKQRNKIFKIVFLITKM